MQQTDTIAAVATSMSDAGIGIIRISGKDAVACAERITEKPLSERKANTIRLNRIREADGYLLDEVLVSVMRAPLTYTGEDIVEINTHGGRLVMEHVMERLLTAGEGLVRLAEPGEFSKRAFLNGKMDLTKAEAIQDLIGAQTSFALRNAAAQLSGILEKRVHALREAVLEESAFIEAALDDPDVYEEELREYGQRIKRVLDKTRNEIGALLNSFDEGVLRRDGVRCAIIGPPNAGKSTLLNLLTQTERAIVTSVPGTTRDVIEETVRLGELILRVQDTAGIRHTDDRVEKIGVTRARVCAENADLIILVLDAANVENDAIDELFSMTTGKHVVVLLNKSDLTGTAAAEKQLSQLRRRFSGMSREKNADNIRWLCVSLKNRTGIEDLRDLLESMYFTGTLVSREAFYMTNLRHRESFLQAEQALDRVKKAVTEGVSEDLYVSDLMDAYEALGKITGETLEDDLAEKIFASFCLGK